MQLTDIKQVESLVTGAIYSAISSEHVHPGQNLKFNTVAEILRCQSESNGNQLLFYSAENLPDHADANVIGAAFDWHPDEPVTMF